MWPFKYPIIIFCIFSIYMYVSMSMYICMYIWVCMYICMCVYVRMYVCTYTYECMYVCTYVIGIVSYVYNIIYYICSYLRRLLSYRKVDKYRIFCSPHRLVDHPLFQNWKPFLRLGSESLDHTSALSIILDYICNYR